MKRSTPLTRRTPIARGTSRLQRKAMKRKPPKRTDDPGYLAKVRLLPCMAAGLPSPHPGGFGENCYGRRHAHHATYDRGYGQKNPDAFAFCLCETHHTCFHAGCCVFDGWDKAKRREWQEECVAATKAAIALMEMPSDGHGARRGMR